MEILEVISEIWNNYGDKRTSEWILTKNLNLCLALLVIFIFISHVSDNIKKILRTKIFILKSRMTIFVLQK
jgi:hypothetical protein